jgi:hypothetical protein
LIESRTFQRDHSLIGEGLRELDGWVIEWPRGPDDQNAEDSTLRQERYRERRARRHPLEVAPLVGSERDTRVDEGIDRDHRSPFADRDPSDARLARHRREDLLASSLALRRGEHDKIS